jgi:hypothetical protein
MVSGRYFNDVGDALCLKLIPLRAVISVSVIGEGNCGAGFVGRFNSVVYDLPVGVWAIPEKGEIESPPAKNINGTFAVMMFRILPPRARRHAVLQTCKNVLDTVFRNGNKPEIITSANG